MGTQKTPGCAPLRPRERRRRDTPTEEVARVHASYERHKCPLGRRPVDGRSSQRAVTTAVRSHCTADPARTLSDSESYWTVALSTLVCALCVPSEAYAATAKYHVPAESPETV